MPPRLLLLTMLVIPVLALAACGRPEDRADSGAGGSAAGTGGSAGGAAGTGGASDCLDLSHAPIGRYDFRVVGTGFDAYDGETVRAVVVYMSADGHGIAATTIRNGTFEIALTQRLPCPG